MVDGRQQPDFDSIKQVNPYGREYWSARELAPLLGYARSWENFEHAIEKAKVACEESGNTVSDHFHASMKMVGIGSKASRETKDYLLSRLACYLIAMNGNTRKKQVADAQLYFAIKTRKQEIHELREEQEARIETRQRVSESYKMLGVAASDAGVNSNRFGIFIDSGYLGLHGLTLEELKERKGVPADREYLDNITREELSAIDLKNVLTERRLVSDNVSEESQAITTHHFVGRAVRRAIEEAMGPMPEDLPTAPDIRAEIEARNRKTRRITKKRKESDSRDTLF